MDIQSILISFAGSSVLTSIVGWLVNRKLNIIAAQKAEVGVKSDIADYTAKILLQAEERVKQALSDRDRAIRERDEAYMEAKEQRKAKQEYRDKAHKLEIRAKELEFRLKEEQWHRCEAVSCKDRIPPRIEK
jgi:hypothetical protein